ncbi:hypothetical protein ACN47E_010314 [Coniothyrium glycines]
MSFQHDRHSQEISFQQVDCAFIILALQLDRRADQIQVNITVADEVLTCHGHPSTPHKLDPKDTTICLTAAQLLWATLISSNI